MTSGESFNPARGLSNGHAMTLAAWAWPRTWARLPLPDIRLIRVSDDTQVRVDCYWQASRQERPTVVGLHGLEGSSQSHYMRGLADKAFARGWNVVLINQRNCGGTEHLTPGLYHSGLTADPIAALTTLHAEVPFTRLGIVGYSLGGNLTLRIAAELAAGAYLPLAAVATVCPTVDLSMCVDAIDRQRDNALYRWHFLIGLKSRLRRKAALFPGRYDLTPLKSIRTVRQFDDAYTAPHNGFGTAANYYAQATSLRTMHEVAVPALILTAADDPFVPVSQFSRPEITGNPRVQVRVTPHGGHCGYVARETEWFDGYWAESTALDFLAPSLRRG